jgi:murein DD-endopeptidase MepM/ murein hydrolase activator NlpD
VKVSKKKKDSFLSGEILPQKGFEDSLLAVEGVQLKHAIAITNALRFQVDFRYLIAGEKFKLKFNKDKSIIEKFIYTPDIITSHILTYNEKTKKYDYEKKILPTKTRYRILEGTITTTLNKALKDRGDVSNSVRAVVNNVLECLVSFRTDARVGDKYLVLLEEKVYDREVVPGAKVLYACYEGKRAGKNEAFYYSEKDEKSAYNGHYSRDGKALIHSSMRMPLDRIHVTSPFGMRRHPITGKKKFHYGVDYRGKIGDPVYSVAKGKVVKTGRSKVGGKFVEIKHADGTTTVYMHLSRIAVRRGIYVKAHEIIGKVGNTGRVSGPHLHFGIKSPRGKWLNPLRKKMIATPVLKGKRKKLLDRQIKEIENLLKQAVYKYNLQKAIKESGLKISTLTYQSAD